MGPPKNHQDVTRAERKAKKRKLEDAIPDLPGEEGGEVDAVEVEDGEKKSKKRKRDSKVEDVEHSKSGESKEDKKVRKKEKKQKDSEEKVEPVSEEAKTEAPEEAGEEAPRKSKKERKAERKAKEAEEKSATAAVVATETKDAATTNSAGEPAADGGEEKKSKKNNRNREKKRKGANGTPVGENGEEKSGAPARFIVFIGNLPFSATKASITKHFATVKPKSVRVATQKEDSTKCKGFGFVEFDGYDHMKTCLKLLHHSTFDDGLSPARKINVELTAGGGGNTKERKSKIQSKNVKLNEERVRKLQEEEKAKWEKKSHVPADESGIHPSRRAIVPRA